MSDLTQKERGVLLYVNVPIRRPDGRILFGDIRHIHGHFSGGFVDVKYAEIYGGCFALIDPKTVQGWILQGEGHQLVLQGLPIE